MNIFTGQTTAPGLAELPNWVTINANAAGAVSTSGPQGAGVTVPAYGSLAMLILSALTIGGDFFLKTSQSGFFLAS